MYYEAMEDYPRAIEYYEKSLEANPHGITTRATLEHLRKKMGKKNG
jgi:tetratricopeptide (TPR) repeat protein